MATVKWTTWRDYEKLLAKISQTAADEFTYGLFNPAGVFGGAGWDAGNDAIVDFAYALVTKYSEASSAAACVYYDELAELSGVTLPAAIPAESAAVSTVAKAVNFTRDESQVASALGRLVKQAGQDTTLINAIRDGAQVAWLPSGDTCAFCIALASNGWQHASERTLKGGHAQHIHSNCDCAYAVRFNEGTEYQGYNPKLYKRLYDSTDGTPDEKIDGMRRMFYQQNKDKINAQKRDAYAKRKERESSQAEELDVN